MREKPVAEAVEIGLPLRKFGEHCPGAAFQHVVEAICPPVRQMGDEGVLTRQLTQQRPRAVQPRHGPRHLRREFVRLTHHRQQQPFVLLQRRKQRRREHLVDIRPLGQQRALFVERAQIKVYRREPALACLLEPLRLRLRQIQAAAPRVDIQLRPVQPQIVLAEL